MRRKINNIISVTFSLFRFFIIKIFNYKTFYFKMIERISPNVVIEKEKKAKLIFGNKVRIHSGSKLKVRENGTVIIGDNVSFNYNCMLFCRKEIIIENGVEFGPNVLIYDHDHDYKIQGGLKEGKFIEESIRIGENTWIGANTLILRGSEIGKNCVIGAGSVVKGRIPDDTLFIQNKENIIRRYGRDI